MKINYFDDVKMGDNSFTFEDPSPTSAVGGLDAHARCRPMLKKAADGACASQQPTLSPLSSEELMMWNSGEGEGDADDLGGGGGGSGGGSGGGGSGGRDASPFDALRTGLTPTGSPLRANTTDQESNYLLAQQSLLAVTDAPPAEQAAAAPPPLMERGAGSYMADVAAYGGMLPMGPVPNSVEGYYQHFGLSSSRGAAAAPMAKVPYHYGIPQGSFQGYMQAQAAQPSTSAGPQHLQPQQQPRSALGMQMQPRMTAAALNMRQRNTAPIRKQPGVPHSEVEKQRRDRINSIVDELRPIVPLATGARETQDSRRAKHEVLSDTVDYIIALEHHLEQGRQRIDDLEQRVKTQSRQLHEMSAGTSGDRAREGGGAAGGRDELAGNMSVPTVDIITDEYSRTILTLSCADRSGLLSDIMRALKKMPLHVKSANVMTQNNGLVDDKFEIVLDDGAPSFGVLKQMFIDIFLDVTRENAPLGDKRRRPASPMRYNRVYHDETPMW